MRLITRLLILVTMFSSTFWKLNVHYCNGEYKSSSFFSESKKCWGFHERNQILDFWDGENDILLPFCCEEKSVQWSAETFENSFTEQLDVVDLEQSFEQVLVPITELKHIQHSLTFPTRPPPLKGSIFRSLVQVYRL